MCESTVPEKACTLCGVTYPALPEFFAPHKKGLYGLQSRCRACKKIVDAQTYAKNPGKHASRTRAYYEANKEHILAEQYAWRRQHPELYAKQLRAYRQGAHRRNPEKYRVQARNWRIKNPDAAKAIKHRRRAREAVGTHFAAADVTLKREQQQGRCYWCQLPLFGVEHIDHIIPLSKGGGNNAANICLSCPSCNHSKNAKMPWQFAGRLF